MTGRSIRQSKEMGSGRCHFRWRVRDQLADKVAIGCLPERSEGTGKAQVWGQSTPGTGLGAEHPRQRVSNGAHASGADWQGGAPWEHGAADVARLSAVESFRGSAKDLDFISTDTGRHWRGWSRGVHTFSLIANKHIKLSGDNNQKPK